MVNRRKFLLSGAATVASPFVCRAYGEALADIELNLALDTSSSMFTNKIENVSHWDFQLYSHLFALSQPEVIQKFLGQKIHLRILFWSSNKPRPAIFDAGIQSENDVALACASLRQNGAGCTSSDCNMTIHAAVVQQVMNLPRRGHRSIIDIVTDEPTLTGAAMKVELDLLRKKFSAQFGTVNVLAVGMSTEDVQQLQDTLCTKDGFCYVAKTWEDSAEALKRKIIAEIA